MPAPWLNGIHKKKHNAGVGELHTVNIQRPALALLFLLAAAGAFLAPAAEAYGSELKYDSGVPASYYYLRTSGHAVHFTNPDAIVLSGIRIFGCKWNSDDPAADIDIYIWDDSLRTLYHNQVPYASVPLGTITPGQKCSSASGWADIPLPSHPIHGNFYVSVFTGSTPISDNLHGIYVGFSTGSAAGSSHSTQTAPNRFVDVPLVLSSMGNTTYAQSEVDWMIRAVYIPQNGAVPSPAGSAAGNPVSASTLGSTGAAATQSPAGAAMTHGSSGDGSSPLPLPVVLGAGILCIGAAAGAGYALLHRKDGTKGTPAPAVPARAVAGAGSHHDVFISYASADKATADAACAKLESRQIRCWIAPRDVPPGMDFPAAIIRGIEGSRVMVLIFSSRSNVSPHVLREITKAVNRGIIIIPFRIENVLPSQSMEYLINIPHWLDAITPPLEQHLDTLAATIGKILSDQP